MTPPPISHPSEIGRTNMIQKVEKRETFVISKPVSPRSGEGNRTLAAKHENKETGKRKQKKLEEMRKKRLRRREKPRYKPEKVDERTART
jgi:hypothetical protein